MLCLETLIKVYTYRLHKSHQGINDGNRVILITIAYDQRNKTEAILEKLVSTILDFDIYFP